MTETKQARSARNRRYHARQKDGQIVLPLVVDEVAIIEALIDRGWLSPADQDDRKKVLAAFAAADMTVKVLLRTADHGPVAIRRVQTTLDDED